jgi:hydroxymethylpyrimidine pyrophosphatase-like HAD family hydrolase
MESRALKYSAIATDYDGTIAHDGIVDEPTVAALRRAREAGLTLLLVTGRELPSLFNTFQHTELFDLVVAENGAVLYSPHTRAVNPLAPPPPPALLDILQRATVPLSVGHSIVATVTPHEQTVLDAIRTLRLEWHVIFNKGAVMALPATVTKASGLSAALTELALAAEATIGVGDAENDHAFLDACGLSVAVANALSSVKDHVDLVTAGARGHGFQELVERLLAGELDNLRLATRRG